MVPRLTPFAKKLLIGLFAIYVLQLILENWAGIPVAETLALNAGVVGVHTLWQLITYVVVQRPGPDGVIGFLVNMVFLWWAVAYFEERFGGRRAMQLSLVATIAAGLSALAVGVAVGAGVLYGVSSIVLAAIAAFAYSLKGRGMLSFFGLFTLQPMHLVYLMLGFSVLLFLASRNLVELAANFGAVGAGILFARWMQSPRAQQRKPSGGGKKRPFKVLRGGNKDGDGPRWLN